MTEEEVEAAALSDPDARPFTREEMAAAHRVPRIKTSRRTLGLTLSPGFDKVSAVIWPENAAVVIRDLVREERGRVPGVRPAEGGGPDADLDLASAGHRKRDRHLGDRPRRRHVRDPGRVLRREALEGSAGGRPAFALGGLPDADWVALFESLSGLL
jgi:hypothetical protein